MTIKTADCKHINICVAESYCEDCCTDLEEIIRDLQQHIALVTSHRDELLEENIGFKQQLMLLQRSK